MYFAYLPSAKAENENSEKSRQATALRFCMVKLDRAQNDGQSGHSGAGEKTGILEYSNYVYLDGGQTPNSTLKY